MTKHFCDRCGKNVTDAVQNHALSGVMNADWNGDGTATHVVDHLCAECYDAVWDFARTKPGQVVSLHDAIAAVVADYVRHKRDAARLRQERVISYCFRAEPDQATGADVFAETGERTQEQPCWKGRDGGEDNALIFKPENWCEGCTYRQQLHELYREATKQRGIAERRLMHLAKKLGAVPELVLPPRPVAPVPEPASAPDLVGALAAAATPGVYDAIDDDIPF